MKRITVPLKSRSYSIVIGPTSGLASELKRIQISPKSPLLIITSAKIKKAGHLKKVLQTLKKSGFHPQVAVISDGEKNKNLQTVSGLFKTALTMRLDRNSTVLALGGGVITDLVGFFAATYMRGIRYVSVPTTLLAMVDAAIGGKTGVDLHEGKNLMGNFWQPSLVWVDPQMLSTLPSREWKTGMAEVVKYGVIRDKEFFQWIEAKVRKQPDVSSWSNSDLEKILFVSAKTKADVVGADEKETPLKGGREILNFGHTIGHALEAATGYKTLTHGEAISIGMVAAGQMSLRLKSWSKDAQLQLMLLFEALKLPIHPPKLSKSQWARFWSSLKNDKKHISGKLRFVLPRSLGSVRVQSGIDPKLVQSVLN